jgi:hypothetical protein
LMKSVTGFGGGKVLSDKKSWESHSPADRNGVTHLFISDKEAAAKGKGGGGGGGGAVLAAESADVVSLTYDQFVHWCAVWRPEFTVGGKRRAVSSTSAGGSSGEVAAASAGAKRLKPLADVRVQ